jgi:hypothetical protein
MDTTTGCSRGCHGSICYHLKLNSRTEAVADFTTTLKLLNSPIKARFRCLASTSGLFRHDSESFPIDGTGQVTRPLRSVRVGPRLRRVPHWHAGGGVARRHRDCGSSDIRRAAAAEHKRASVNGGYRVWCNTVPILKAARAGCLTPIARGNTTLATSIPILTMLCP